VNVPNVVGETLTQAQKELTQAVLRVNENITDANGYVSQQSPRAGTQVKVGTLVYLKISESGS
jgi:beta-lactam-binding protein with PASTA domain